MKGCDSRKVVRKILMAALVSGAVADLRAAEDNWWTRDGELKVSGDISSNDHWNLGNEALTRWRFNDIPASWESEVKLTVPANYAPKATALFVYAEAGQTVELTGGDLLFPARDDVDYSWEPLLLGKGNGRSGSSVFYWQYQGSPNRRAAVMDWRDVHAIVASTAEKTSVDFIGGTLALTNQFGRADFFGAAIPCAEVTFRDGANFLCNGGFNLIGNAITNRLTFVGGDHFLSNGAVILYDIGQGWTTEQVGLMEMILSKGARLETKGANSFIAGGIGGARTTENKTMRIVVKEGSLLDMGVRAITARGAGTVEVLVDGGSELRYGDDMYFPMASKNTDKAQYITSRLVGTDGAFINGNGGGSDFFLGSDDQRGDAEACPSEICLTNSALQVGANLYVQAGEVHAVCSCITNNILYLGRTAHPSAVNLAGGELILRSTSTSSAVGHTGIGTLAASEGAVVRPATKLTVGQEAGSSGTLSLASGATFVGNEIAGGSGTSALVADGGVLAPSAAAPNLLHGLTSAKLTAKGLTVRSDSAVTIAQSFTDAEGEAGVLRLGGRGEKTLSGTASDVSAVVVSEGALVFTDTARCASTVVVTNGATVAFGGSSADGTLKGLVLGDAESTATLVLTPEKKIAVDGTIALDHLRVVLEGGFAQGTYTVLEATGDVSEATRSAWQYTLVHSGTPSGCVATFACGEEGGKTAFTMTLAPAVEHRITVPEGTSQTIGTVERLGANEMLTVDVREGAAAEITAALGAGNFVKEGRGALTLTSAENDFFGRLSTFGGLFAVPNLLALGFERFGLGTFTLGAGTLQLGEAGADEQRFEPRLVVETPADAIPGVVVKTDSDIVMASPEMRRGAILKRGAGRLTLEVEGVTALTVTNASAGYNSGMQQKDLVFDESGNVPTGPDAWYVGFNVLEGETVVRGLAPGARVETTHHVAVGASVTSGTANPGFVVDNAAFVSSGAGCRFHLACGISANNPFAESPYLFVTNNATFQCGWLNVSENSATRYPRLSPRILVDHSVFKVGNMLVTGDWHYPEWTFRNDARFYSNQLYAGAKRANFVFDASICAKNADLEPLEYYDVYSYYERDSTFRNGSLFCCDRIVSNAGKASCTNFWNFDDSEWRPAKGDFAFSFPNAWNQLVRVTGRGLILAPPAEATWRMPLKVTGEGGLVKRGAGTLVFDTNEAHGEKVAGDPVTLDCTGTVAVEEGTLRVLKDAPRAGLTFAVADGATLDFADAVMADVTVAGAGRVTGGTLAGLTIVPDAEAVPTFDGAQLGGAVAVDFGRTAESPLEAGTYVVARYAGAAPSFANWTAKGLGRRGLKIVYTAAEGVITATVDVSGLVLIVR